MPGPADDRAFGGSRGASQKAYAAMKKRYGAGEGVRIYHATLAKRRAQGKAGLRSAAEARLRGRSSR